MSDITWMLKSFGVNSLTDYYKNPRNLTKDQFAQLKTSLDKFGVIDKPIINLDAAHTVIGGHQRLHVLRSEKVETVDCWVPDRELDAKEVEELNVRLNKNTGAWDFDILANSFEVPDLLEWVFTEKELQLGGFNLDEPEGEDPGAQIDRADELQEKWQVNVGDLWTIGEHRLLCGDSVKLEDIDRVMGGEKAQLCWTDPPWNVAYGEGFRGGESALGWKKRTIINDNLGDKFPEFVDGFVAQIHNALVPGGVLYMAMSAQEWGLIMQALEDGGFHWSSTIIWAKDSLVVSRKDYHTQYEPVWYGWKSDAARVCEVEDRKQSDLWHIDRPKSSPEHPTMKPVELVERSIGNSSRKGDVVIDPFLGSGTTMVAAQRLGRRCFGLEIAPKYCAVVLERMSEMGLTPELVGEPALLEVL